MISAAILQHRAERLWDEEHLVLTRCPLVFLTTEGSSESEKNHIWNTRKQCVFEKQRNRKVGFFYFFVCAAAFAFTSLESYVSTVYFPGGFPESFAALSSYKTRSPSKATTTTHTTFFHGEKGLHSPLNWHTFYKWIHRKEPLLICTLSKAPEKSLA